MDKKPKVFLTGANGFIACHILSDLVEQDYRVTASVRTEQKGQELLELHPAWKSNVTFVSVPDITAADGFDRVFDFGDDGFDYIIHNASPVNFSTTDFQTELIDPAVKGTTALIKCAHKRGGRSLKRFVLLGSSVAVINSFENPAVPGKDYTEEDWNPVTAEYAIKNKDVLAAYNTSKKLAEQAAWRFMEETKPSFDLTVLNPNVVIGPMLQVVKKPEQINETNGFAVYKFLNGEYKRIEDIRFPFYHFVDVRDLARAHVLALTGPAASNQRILLISGLITPQLVVDIIRQRFPELRSRVIEGNPGQIYPAGIKPTGWDTSKSHRIFGPDWSYRGLEESVVDTVNCILQLEKQWKS